MKSKEGRARLGQSPEGEGNKKQSKKNPGVGSGHGVPQAKLRLEWRRLPAGWEEVELRLHKGPCLLSLLS